MGGASGGPGPGSGPGVLVAAGDSGEPTDELSEDVGFRLGQLHRRWRLGWERSIADLGLSAPQAAALRAASSQPGTAIRGLARVLGTDPMNARRLAQDLQRMGLVEVSESLRDRRAKGVWPTARGDLLADQVAQRARARRQRLVAQLGEDSYLRLGELLDQLAGLKEPAVAETERDLPAPTAPSGLRRGDRTRRRHGPPAPPAPHGSGSAMTSAPPNPGPPAR